MTTTSTGTERNLYSDRKSVAESAARAIDLGDLDTRNRIDLTAIKYATAVRIIVAREYKRRGWPNAWTRTTREHLYKGWASAAGGTPWFPGTTATTLPASLDAKRAGVIDRPDCDTEPDEPAGYDIVTGKPETKPAKPEPHSAADDALKVLRDALHIVDPVSTEQVRKMIDESLDEALGKIDVERIKTAVRETIDQALTDLPPLVIKYDGDKTCNTKGKHRLFATLFRYVKMGGCRVWLRGPAGSGKTHAVEQVAQELGVKMFVMINANENFEVVGHRDAAGTIHDTQLSEFVRYEGDAVLLIDEVDGWGHAAQLASNTVLSNGWAILPDGKHDMSHGGKYNKTVIATGNTYGLGPDATYVGRLQSDGAFLDRFEVTIDWPYDPRLEKGIALASAKSVNKDFDPALVTSLYEDVTKVRRELQRRSINVTLSTRRFSVACRSLAAGFALKEVWVNSLLPSLKESDRQSLVPGYGSM